MKAPAFKFHVKPEWANRPLHKLLPAAMPHLPKKDLQGILEGGGVFVNGNRIDKGTRLAKAGDDISVIIFDPQAVLKRYALAQDVILYYKDDILAVAKPAGIAVQRSNNPLAPNMEDLVTDLGRRLGLFRKATLCHRLDKETSGVLLLATNGARTHELMEAFHHQQVEKTYWAICHGVSSDKNWQTANLLSSINQRTGTARSVKNGGRSAITEFKLLAHDKDRAISLIECRPKTGRSHQIRIHLSEAGLPIVGDKRYGGVIQKAAITSDFHLLHAKTLTVTLQKRHLEFTAPLPPHFSCNLPIDAQQQG